MGVVLNRKKEILFQARQALQASPKKSPSPFPEEKNWLHEFEVLKSAGMFLGIWLDIQMEIFSPLMKFQ